MAMPNLQRLNEFQREKDCNIRREIAVVDYYD